MRAGVVVQARLSSERLPGKVLLPLAGRPMLGWLLERLHTVAEAERIIVATSDRPQDAAVAEFAASAGVATFRGPLDDVLARFVGAADAYGLDAFVRVSGDSPLLDPGLVSAALRLFAEGGWDLVTNVQVRTFPRGQSVEAIAVAALRRVAADTQHPADREHVTPYLYANPERFRIRNFTLSPPAPDVRFCVDTPEDFETVERMLRSMTRPHFEYDVKALLALHREIRGDDRR
jgi:spore coat polysaccharide biosynthesis protein SpsF